MGLPATVGALVVGVVLLVGAGRERVARASSRSCRCGCSRSRERSGAYAARMLYLGAMIGFFYFTTQYLQDVLGFSPLQAGLGFLPDDGGQLRGRAWRSRG